MGIFLGAFISTAIGFVFLHFFGKGKTAEQDKEAHREFMKKTGGFSPQQSDAMYSQFEAFFGGNTTAQHDKEKDESDPFKIFDEQLKRQEKKE